MAPKMGHYVDEAETCQYLQIVSDLIPGFRVDARGFWWSIRPLRWIAYAAAAVFVGPPVINLCLKWWSEW